MRLAFYGGGKGKTSAALGIALRSWGHGLKVLYAGVMKTPMYLGEEVGEYKALRKIGVDTVYLTDLGRPEKVFEYVLASWRNYDVVILDELLYAVRQRFISPTRLAELASIEAHVVATGGYWTEELAQYFDLITELREVRHPFRQGQLAVRGLDY